MVDFFIACCFKSLQNVCRQSLPLEQSSLFIVASNEHGVNNEQPEGICLYILVVNKFFELLWQVVIYSTKDSKSA